MPGGPANPTYHSLERDHVYKSTTTIPEQKFNVFESLLKKAYTVTASAAQTVVKARNRSEPLIDSTGLSLARRMQAESMDDVDLRQVTLSIPLTRSLARTDPTVEEVYVETDRGSILVAVAGNRGKPAILTYHDLGLNYISNFQAFFNFSDMRSLLENFSVYHVNAPGQEEGASPLADDYIYPTMDELSNQLLFVLSYFGLHSVIGLGVGAGGNILARFALTNPDKVEALCLVNVVSTQSGWIEWGYQKINSRYLKSKGMTQGVLDYLMWHHFGRNTEDRNHDLVQVYKSYFEQCVNPINLALLIDAYIRRTDLNIARDLENRTCTQTLGMPVMNITGAFSPHVDDTVILNSRLDPTSSSWMKISDCGMVLEEQPSKLTEALRLFLQGLGYVLSQTIRVSVSGDSVRSSPWPIRITENPIDHAVHC
uniref:Protein NDRG3 n=1 Tax=Cacopsylla melanoneura TaxID=428564 RepID=A0A8D8Y2M3_9HEMI